MSQLEEIKEEMTELKSSMEHLRLENVKLREKLAAIGEIAQRAYLKWVAAGRPDDKYLEHWLAAEKEVLEGVVISTESPPESRLLWAFFSGIGSVLEIFPAPGRFDRWRKKESIPETEWEQLFREISAPAPKEKPSNGVGS